ncbi:MAG: nucleotidyltransferase family protein [Campylobacterota bacterium]|nr:nucleotidyltransferase family protein [Campylobacterota bacterium]
MTKEIILSFLNHNRTFIKEKFGVTKIGLFGSYARGEANISSDIDIAVEIESKNSFRSFFSLLHFLEDGLKSKVDLGIENSMKPIAKKTILKDIIYV